MSILTNLTPGEWALWVGAGALWAGALSVLVLAAVVLHAYLREKP